MVGIRVFVVSLLVVAVVLPVQPAAATSSVVDAQRQFDQAQAQLAQVNDRMERTQAHLDLLDHQLTTDQAAEKKTGDELAAMARYQYSQPSLPLMVLSARSLSEVLNDIVNARILSDRQRQLLDRERKLRAQDQQARNQTAADLAQVQKDREQAAAVAASAQATLATAKEEAARQQAAQLMAMATAVSSPRPWSGANPGNHFAYGYCTWYVANRRPIPWFGNAIEWWPNARAYGFSEGQAPAPGAVMVTRESGYGHVAYVESVHPDGSWTVSEMNYVAWGVVSSRTIYPGQVPLVGFIY